MNLVDLAMGLVVALMAWVGWRNGLQRSVWAFLGFIGGAALAIAVTPHLLGHFSFSVWLSLAALLLVATGAIAGRAGMLWLETRVRRTFGWRPGARIDRPGGLVVGMASALIVCWMVGLALAGSTLPRLGPAANASAVLGVMDAMRLPLGHVLVRSLTAVGHDAGFPRYVDPFTPEHIVAVAAPDPDVVHEQGVRRAAKSAYKVIGRGSGTLGAEGTVFLVGKDRVMTAAHVVDGMSDLKIGEVPATVVVCDPAHDVAVLDAPGLGGAALEFADASAGESAAVIGFPADGPLEVSAVRIRSREEIQSTDIRGSGEYDNHVYAVRGIVREGNSGGPMVDQQGRVLGVVVAFSRSSSDTGYVVDRQQVAEALREGLSASPDPAANQCLTAEPD